MGYEDSTGVELNVSSLYRVDNNPSVPCKAESMVRPVSISNGLAWREDNKVFYYVDTVTRRVDAYDYNLTAGTICKYKSLSVSFILWVLLNDKARKSFKPAKQALMMTGNREFQLNEVLL